ncbi:MAG: proton-conducting transporter membrane subunit [Anaerolineae bacterium]
MPPALWLIALPLGAVPLVYLLRKVAWGALVAALVALILAGLVIQTPTGVILELLGRSVELDRLSQIILTLIFVATAFLFLIPVVMRGAATRTLYKDEAKNKRVVLSPAVRARLGRTFYPVGLAVVGLFVAASLSRHLGFIAIFMQGAVILTVFIIQEGRLDSTRAALRFLILMSLATPLFLLAAWRIDFYQLSGGLQTAAASQQTIFLVGVGFAILLAVAPFHGWLTSIAAEASSAVAAFVLITFPAVAISALLHVLADFPWLVGSSQVINAIIIAGIATAFVGGVMASVQRGFSELMGCAALYDLGCTLAVLGLGGSTAVLTILVGLAVRALALMLIAACASAIRLRTSRDGFAELRGVAQQMPVATIGLLLGGLSLAGAPFTAGFASHWQLLRTMVEADPRGLILLTIAGLGVAIGYVRGFRATLAPPENAGKNGGRLRFTLQEPPGALGLISLLVVVIILLGLFPAVVIEPLQILAAGISVPIP